MPRHQSRSRSRSQSRDRLLEANGSGYPLQTFEDPNHATDDWYDNADPPLASRSKSGLKQHSNQAPRSHHAPVSWPKTSHRIIQWIRGPAQPRLFHITPLLETVEQSYAAWITRRRKRTRAALIVLALSLCLSLFLLSKTAGPGCSFEGYGKTKSLSCISRLWPNSTICGVDGRDCRPFHDQSFAFNCPADCEGVKIWNPRYVGNEEINYRPLVIGGPIDNGTSIYRGDSFICGAARHAGLISNSGGGSGIIRLVGEQRQFPAVVANGISSVGFQPSFPQAFTFLESFAAQTSCAGDLRFVILGVSLVYTILFSVLAPQPISFFWTNFTFLFFCVALAMDPPNAADYNEVISSAVGRFLPAAFVATVIYRYCVYRALSGFKGHVEKTVLWLGPCWVGALNKYTFDQLPLQRLTPHDLQSQPGAVLVLVIIVLVITAIALGQAWAFRLEGRLPRYLALYATFAVGLLILVAVPGLHLRLHHYILALLLLPGTTIQTRPSLIYQGLLVGLFISGVARWGFASILETSAVLIADGPVGGAIPQVAIPTISGDEITFSWANLTHAGGPMGKPQDAFDSVSILINDVERFRGIEDHNPDSFTWTKHRHGEIEFFRMAYVKFGQVGRDVVFDYTRPATWHTNGTWSHFGS